MIVKNKGYMMASICWMAASVFMLISSSWLLGVAFGVLAIVFGVLTFQGKGCMPGSCINIHEICMADEVFKAYIADSDNIKAVKRCRELTGVDLAKANNYVDSILKK